MDASVELPDKLFFKIGEVARLVGVEPYVLRYWESEFGTIRPRKSRGGQRLYRRADVETLLRVKQLLRDEGFTISGARKRLSMERASGDRSAEPAPAAADPEQTGRLVEEIARLKGALAAATDAVAEASRRAAARAETIRALRVELASLREELDRLSGA